jgi:hypothetical protein
MMQYVQGSLIVRTKEVRDDGSIVENEESYIFSSVDQLLDDFARDIQDWSTP